VSLGFGRGEAARLVDNIAREQALESVEEIIRAVFRSTQQG
jgi:Holliday junction resolvasome RuvABC DNA-binding subunit